jgi:hypothetical protein
MIVFYDRGHARSGSVRSNATDNQSITHAAHNPAWGGGLGTREGMERYLFAYASMIWHCFNYQKLLYAFVSQITFRKLVQLHML